MPNTRYAFEGIEDVTPVIVTNAADRRFAASELELLDGEWMVKFPFLSEPLEVSTVCDADLGSFRKVLSVGSHPVI
jgi:hypothetical protein